MEQTVSIQDFREMKVAEGSIRFGKGQDLDDKGDFIARKEKERSLLAGDHYHYQTNFISIHCMPGTVLRALYILLPGHCPPNLFITIQQMKKMQNKEVS